ncbi:MAG: choice-of-anchor I family protein, partial [Gammaproteobacteria bacterium]
MNRTTRWSSIALLAATGAMGPAHALDLSLIGSTSPGISGFGEIVQFSSVENSVFTTRSEGVQVLTFNGDGSFSDRGTLDFSSVFGAPAAFNGASSTAADPLGRGFGAVSLIPTDNGGTLGKVGFFDYRSGSFQTLGSVDVGFHPDSVSFSDDGTRLFVANEGERTTGGDTDAPGSLSIIDLSGVVTTADLAGVSNANVQTFDFQAANLGPGASLAGVRVNDLTATETFRHIEPEFVSQLGSEVYVSLQENNALAVFDLEQSRFSAVHKLGTITNTIDASNTDGPNVDDSVAGLPMPDTIASFMSDGVRFVVTANEGDARGDDGDVERVADLGDVGLTVDAGTAAALDAIYGDFTADDALGRLKVSTIDGDTNGDGDIDVLTAMGTRGFSIWNAESGDLVFDSGSLEGLLLALDADRHNVNDDDPTDIDTRSDDKGPEPEALVLGEFGGALTLFVGMERQHGILAYDLSDPTSPTFLEYVNGADDGLLSPESLFFIPQGMSPTGTAVLLAGFEEGGGAIGAYSVV